MAYTVKPSLNGTLQQEYQADPRVLMALQAMQSGGSTAPLQGGGIGEGIARALQGVAGGYMAKQMRDEYQGKQQDQYGAIADILAPPQQLPGMTQAPVDGGPGIGKIDGSIGPTQVQGDNRDKIMSALQSGLVKPETFGAAIADNLGFGKKKDPIKLGKNDRLLSGDDPTKELVGAMPEPRDPNKPFYIDANGNQVANPDYQSYEKGLRTAGAPQSHITVNAGNSFGSGLGAGAADALKASQANAQGAAGTIQQGNQILEALDSGKVMSGPGTSFKIAAGQLFGGDQEKLNQTRQVIKGLAEITLQSRKMLAGQGQVSNNEQALLERARSGNVDDMSIGEIRTVVNLNNRISKQVLAQHQKNLGAAAKAAGPDAAPFLNMYNVDEPTPYAPRAAGGAPTKTKSGASVSNWPGAR